MLTRAETLKGAVSAIFATRNCISYRVPPGPVLGCQFNSTTQIHRIKATQDLAL